MDQWHHEKTNSVRFFYINHLLHLQQRNFGQLCNCSKHRVFSKMVRNKESRLHTKDRHIRIQYPYSRCSFLQKYQTKTVSQGEMNPGTRCQINRNAKLVLSKTAVHVSIVRWKYRDILRKQPSPTKRPLVTFTNSGNSAMCTLISTHPLLKGQHQPKYNK